MGFELFASPQVDIDLEEAYEYYKNAPKTIQKFDKALLSYYDTLEHNPFFKVRYKNVRALPFKNFPYIIFFTVNEKRKRVDILSIFNTNQDPVKYPK